MKDAPESRLEEGREMGASGKRSQKYESADRVWLCYIKRPVM